MGEKTMKREYYQDIGYKPFLFYVIFGVSGEDLEVSQKRHHVDEFPEIAVEGGERGKTTFEGDGSDGAGGIRPDAFDPPELLRALLPAAEEHIQKIVPGVGISGIE